MKADITDDEVLRVMVEGGEELCDAAPEKWIGNEYESDTVVRGAYLERWAKIRRRIRPLAAELRILLQKTEE